VFLPQFEALGQQSLILSQVLLVAVELDDRVDLAAVAGDELAFVELEPVR
jgi:hypothetical protein